MQLHVLSAYETTAKEFFGQLEEWHTDLVLDTRLKNTNQLSGFTKRDDLAFFVEHIAHARYVHDKLFAPAPTKFERYIHGNSSWDDYAQAYEMDLRRREAIPQFFDRYGSYQSVVLLGTATRQRRSHVEVLKCMIEQARQ